MLQKRLKESAGSCTLGCLSLIWGGGWVAYLGGGVFLAYCLLPNAAGDEPWRAQMCIPSIPQQGS